MHTESTSLPLLFTGEYWYRRLTPYGRDLMRALVKASGQGFPYRETLLEPENSEVPMVMLLDSLDEQIGRMLTGAQDESLLPQAVEGSSYLKERNIAVDCDLLWEELARIVEKVDRGCYTESGYRNLLRRQAVP